MIKFTGYSKSYGDQLILKASLQLGHDIYWLKGENGSGKTTLIKSIAGLIPFSGMISVDGRDINKERTDYRKIVNYAEAEPIYPVFLTGNDLIRFYTKTKGGDDKQVRSLVDALGIASYADNKIGTYSSGMAKKLSLVLGFIGNPKLILLDEPLITLDQQSVANLERLAEQYYNSGVSFLVTSHQEIHFPGHSSSRLSIVNKELTQMSAL